MRNKLGNILLGGIFLAVGIGFLGNALDAWDFNLFFDGWWTLFIIVPCVISMVQYGVNIGSLIGAGIGILLLLWQSDILPLSLGQIFLPAGIILVGLLIIFQGFIFKGVRKATHVTAEGIKSYTAILGGQELNYDGQKFSGCDIVAVLGGIEIDLRKAIIEEDVEITSVTVLGGGKIMLPSNVFVKVACLPILGAVENKAKNDASAGAPTVYVNATCVLGGLELL